MTELAKVGTISDSNKIPVNGTVGPYAEFYSTYIALQGWFSGNGASDCPAGTQFSWTDGNGRLACYLTIQYTD